MRGRDRTRTVWALVAGIVVMTVYFSVPLTLAVDSGEQPGEEPDLSVLKMNLRPHVEKMPQINQVLDLKTIKPNGTRYQATVPDTLDLAERAHLAINALTNFRTKDHYAITQTFRFGSNPPASGNANWTCMGKFIRALPLMRTMCGGEKNLDVEYRAMEAMLKQISEDGQMYFPLDADGPPANTSYMFSSGVAVEAIQNWYFRDRNPAWGQWMQLLCDGFQDAAIRVDDYAFVPPECSLSPDGRWHWTLRGSGDSPGYMPYKPPAEPVHDSQGQEGHVKNEHSDMLWGLVLTYNQLADEQTLDLAERIARFCRKPALWSHDTKNESGPPNEHGIFTGHFHGNIHNMLALLTLAITEDDDPLKQLVREAYEHGRRHGIIKLGFVPGWIKPLMGRSKDFHLYCNEGCGIADMLILAIKLADAGLGDYWDDIDSIVRNHYIELQAIDPQLMKRACGAGDEYDKDFNRFVGGFVQAGLTANETGQISGCCTGNGARALYYAWDGITRLHDGVATVNLLLNRASPWMDIDSYLPYEGRLVLHNKQARAVNLRLPFWITPTEVKYFINDRRMKAHVAGRYAVLADLKQGDTIRIEFPVPQTVEMYKLGPTMYSVTFRGSTVVDISPRATEREGHQNDYPFFVRDNLKARKAPMHTIERFVADRLIPLQ